MYVSIDLGGTNTRIASSKDLGKILNVEKVKTEQNIALERKIIISAIKKLCLEEVIDGICVGVPGFVNKKAEKFKKIVNIPSFSGLSYEDLFGDIVDPDLVIAENDATLAGLGEAVLGAGQNYEVVAYITLSTGVGGVRIAGKKIDPTQNYSEPGHMRIQENGLVCPHCHQSGCISAYISGAAFEDVYKVRPSQCEDREVWEEYAKKLTPLILNVFAMWAPDVIVLGGSISNKFEEYFKEPLFDNLSKQNFFTVTPILKSKLDDNSGLYGGLLLLNQVFGSKS